MKRFAAVARACALCALVGALLWRAPRGLSQLLRPAEVDRRIASLCKTVLANPKDLPAVRRLLRLRKDQRRYRLESLESLRQGLRAHLQGDGALAARELKRASASAYVLELANSVLLTPLEKMFSARGGVGRRPPARCPRCFGTGREDCPRCRGMGHAKCSTCRGVGTLKGTTCNDCGGSGAVVCPRCQGAGVISCTLCARTGAEKAPQKGSARSTEAIRKVISLAGHLRAGGIDLYSPGALRPSVAAEAAKRTLLSGKKP